MDNPNDLTGQERAALVAWDLARGARLNTTEIAKRLGLSLRGVRWLMCRVSRVIPVYQDVDGDWVACGRAGAPPSDTMKSTMLDDQQHTEEV